MISRKRPADVYCGRMSVILIICLLAAGLTSPTVAAADQCGTRLSMPPLFSDHMVLQQGIRMPVWGTAAPGERVSVSFAGQEILVAAGKDGKWTARLNPVDACEQPQKLTVGGESEKLQFNDVLVGDVWLSSGQSNMEASFESLGIADRIQGVSHPQMRISNGSGWACCDAQNLLRFSCVAYYFGRKLQEELHVPIGLVNISQGSSSIEAWMTPDSMEANRDLIDQDGRNLFAEMNSFERFRSDYDSLSPAEKERVFSRHCRGAYGFARQFLDEDGKPRIDKYQNILLHMQFVKPASLYRARIAPLVPFGIRGVIWYQGETNVGDAQYARKQRILIESWRKTWGEGDFPFYIVQVAPYLGYPLLPDFWLQQYEAVKNTSHCGLAPTVDVGELDNYHPVNKRDVGLRLALLALQDAYGRKDVVASGPVYKSLKVEGRNIIVEFAHAENGLIAGDSLPPREFEVAGDDGRFVKVDALIQGNAVRLVSPLENPKYVRYAWHCLAAPNLFNKEGLPALPFNTAEPFFQRPTQ